MPVLDRQLTGHLGGPTIMAVFDDLQQVAAVFITEWGQTPIIQTKRPPAESRWFATTGQAPFGRAKAAYWKINYGQNGFELKAWADPLYGNSGWSRIIKSTDYYFRRGVTFTHFRHGFEVSPLIY